MYYPFIVVKNPIRLFFIDKYLVDCALSSNRFIIVHERNKSSLFVIDNKTINNRICNSNLIKLDDDLLFDTTSFDINSINYNLLHSILIEDSMLIGRSKYWGRFSTEYDLTRLLLVLSSFDNSYDLCKSIFKDFENYVSFESLRNLYNKYNERNFFDMPINEIIEDIPEYSKLFDIKFCRKFL